MASQDSNTEIVGNLSFIDKELKWLEEVLDELNEINSGAGEQTPGRSIYDLAPPKPDNGIYASLLKAHSFGFDERIVLILALAPHLIPDSLNLFKIDQIPVCFGGYVGKNRAFIPTGETVMFILAGDDMGKRLQLLKLFDKNHVFYKENLIFLQEVSKGDPELSGVLMPSRDLIDLVTRGQVRKPDLGPDFPAKLIHTEMNWTDLVVTQHTQNELNEIEQWINYSNQLTSDPKLGKKLKTGFKALFYGPPGTGKTLAATLIGKKTGRDVYRIDLSTVVSKYIGETEKNLRKLFDRAERKKWILFFDEADALFGKRTNVSDAHDRFANQEVSYLLQRIEHFDGVIILATNMKNNIDKAFMRRFHNIVHFQVPKAEERYRLWESAFPEMVKLDDSVDIQKIANDHELTGAHIVNIVSYCSLKAISTENKILTNSIIRNGIARELSKEGRTI